MYYIWKLGGTKKEDYRCNIEKFEGYSEIDWNSGKKITQKLPKIINYYGQNDIIPEDYIFNWSTTFIISEKIFNILQQIKVSDYDYYPSQLFLKNGKAFKGYYTLNILSVLPCLDKEKSIFKVKGKLGKLYKKLCLDINKIPENLKLFRIEEKKRLIIVHKNIVDTFIEEEVKGIAFERLCIERDNWHVGSANYNIDENLG